MDTDALLIQRMRRGDEDAMEIFVRRYYPVILRYCRYHLAQKEDAEDLTQETFVRFFAALPGYHHRGRALNYLYTVSGNLCRDYYRTAEKRPVSLEEEEGRQERSLPMDRIPDRIDLMHALSRLPEEYREVVILHFQRKKKSGSSKSISSFRLRCGTTTRRAGLRCRPIPQPTS